VGETAARLIAEGAVPPFVVAAVDSAGPMRSLNYLPYKPGTGVGNFRTDAERWPGGGCEGYMRRLVTEIMPLVSATFGTASDPARVAFGGGSFAGETRLACGAAGMGSRLWNAESRGRSMNGGASMGSRLAAWRPMQLPTAAPAGANSLLSRACRRRPQE
jgi:hypothetical protein